MLTKVVFVSFRLKALDGVSAEAEKWINVFDEWGCEVHRVAGYIPFPDGNDHVIPELNHIDPQIESFTSEVFSNDPDVHETELEFLRISEIIERGLSAVLDEIVPDVIVVENAFSLPLNLPFTVALCRYIEERGIACIAVHHDFYWQNPKYSKCCLDELLVSHFPVSLPHVIHVTINEKTREELYERTGVAATCIHNCFDFSAPRCMDDFNQPLRGDLGVTGDDIMFLQPTRAIERKGISRSIQFVEDFAHASGRPSKLVVTGSCEEDYDSKFGRMCHNSAAEVLHVPGWLGRSRNEPGAGSCYDVRDAYACCDMVTFPSLREGFGNPVLESIVHRKLLLVADYPVLEELRKFGFQFLSLEGHAVERAIKLMEYPPLMEEMVNRNFEIGRKHFSLEKLQDEMAELVSSVVMPLQ